jgi:FlaA1/EpsC-like NDP-sugar epimerase
MKTGAPITLTDSNIQRYFMHVDEAAFLTLKTYLINSGDIHIFNMGEPVRMLEIVLRMQQLLGSKSQILITGLRDGEKLNELLVEKDSICQQSLYPDIKTLSLNLQSTKDLDSILNAIAFRDESSIINLLERTN